MATATATPIDATAFPKLDNEEMDSLRRMASTVDYSDGQFLFKAGDADLDLFVVESGLVDILNPTDGNCVIATHEPGSFAGDIDVITRRPVIVTAVARGPARVLRVPGSKLRELLNRIPRLGEKLMNAFIGRRKLLSDHGVVGLKVIGPGVCKDTAVVREFLYKSFVPFTWFDTQTPEGQKEFEAAGSPRKTPAIECGGKLLLNPTLPDLAKAAGIWHKCPSQDVDFIIVGAGPAGIAAAVYAASEGLSTLVLDKFGPGGQAGGSSKIENFIGFPSGISGSELGTRGVLQMLKFGAQIVAPIKVQRLIPAEKPGGMHALELDCGTVVRAPAVLVASGVLWRKLEAEGSERFERAGIYYACTSVEALLYNNCDVCVVGAGNSAGQAAMYLAECCRSRTVHMLVRHKLGPGMSEYLANRIRAAKNIELHEGVEIDKVLGKHRVESVELKSHNTPEPITIPSEAVFVFIGAEPHSDWLPDTIARDSQGYLLTGLDAMRSNRWPLTDRDPLPLETTLPGVLAAGDIRSGSTKRVGFAVGDGSLAVTCAHRVMAMKR
jgi:thioredoxin reductase (NADPH)